MCCSSLPGVQIRMFMPATLNPTLQPYMNLFKLLKCLCGGGEGGGIQGTTCDVLQQAPGDAEHKVLHHGAELCVLRPRSHVLLQGLPLRRFLESRGSLSSANMLWGGDCQQATGVQTRMLMPRRLAVRTVRSEKPPASLLHRGQCVQTSQQKMPLLHGRDVPLA